MKALTPFSPLLNEPTPQRMVIRFALVMSLLLIVTQVAAVLHLNVTSIPVLILVATLPAVGVAVAEIIMEQTVARRALHVAWAEAQTSFQAEMVSLEVQRVMLERELLQIRRREEEGLKRLEKERRIQIRTFSKQEQAILNAIVAKQDDREIAATLGITLKDVALVRLKFLRKLRVSSVDELIDVVKRNLR